MRNLARGLIYNFHEDIDKAAFYLRDYVPENPESAVDTAKRGAMDILRGFQEELECYGNFRLEKTDMQEVGKVLCEYLGEHDSACVNGKIDTQHGNESLSLQTGVVIASIIANQKMLRRLEEVEKEDSRRAEKFLSVPRIAQYVRFVYDIFIVDPGDERILSITKKFIAQFPEHAVRTMSTLERLTKEFDEEIKKIPVEEDYFSMHIFSTGFNHYPGIGVEVQILVEELARIEKEK